MLILVTGSAGHLGEALMGTLRHGEHEAIGIDMLESAFTTRIGSITDKNFVAKCMSGVDAVMHTATLHKPHLATHTPQDFVDTNITGTLNLLEAAVRAGVKTFIFTSTTSVFGRAMQPAEGAPAVWVTESLEPEPRNVYGVTKHAAEDLCELAHRNDGLPCIILRTSRFFPEQDDDWVIREAYDDTNIKTVEFLYRRVDLEDVVGAHLCALDCAARIGFGRYIVSATTPFRNYDVQRLRTNAPAVVRERVPEYETEFARRGWRMLPHIDRVYDNSHARRDLGWAPRYDFAYVLKRLRQEEDPRSPLACTVGAKGYHRKPHGDGPYPVK